MLWGLLNEGRDVDLFRRLNDTAHACDSSRLTIYAENKPEEGAPLGTIHVPDVLGLNYKVPHLDELRPLLEGMKVLNSEHSNANIAERFDKEGVLIEDWVENELWQIGNIARDIDEFDKRDWIAGSALWCMHDYGTDYGPVWPMHESGVIDAWRLPKACAHYLRARWLDTPYISILGHWTWPGHEGQPKRVVVVCNAPEVELYLGAQSFGSQRGSTIFEWEVPYRPGVLKAVGKYDRSANGANLRTANEPVGLSMELLPNELPANGTDISLVTAMVVDGAGLRVPNYKANVRFRLDGDATFMGLGGKSEVQVRKGMGRIPLRAGRSSGPVYITARCEDLPEADATLVLR